MDNCPCGSDFSYKDCCEPLIKGEDEARTAEQLMRSRYTAFAQTETEYIFITTHPDQRKNYDHKDTLNWSKKSEWHKLEILETKKGKIEDEEGEIEFIAYFSQNGVKKRHHENSIFRKLNGKWYFVDGHGVVPKQVIRQNPKIGRNDLCQCGSGKKYKKCCL